jgi:hypothetical protein
LEIGQESYAPFVAHKGNEKVMYIKSKLFKGTVWYDTSSTIVLAEALMKVAGVGL